MTHPDDAQAARLLDDPATDAETLARIAEHVPGLRGRVLAHPNVYPGLADWIRQQPGSPGREAGTWPQAHQPPVVPPAGQHPQTPPPSGTPWPPPSDAGAAGSTAGAPAAARRSRSNLWWIPGIAGFVALALVAAYFYSPGGPAGPLATRIELLPAPETEHFSVVVTDLDRAGELLGHPRPTDGGADLGVWLQAVAGWNDLVEDGAPVAVHWPTYFYDSGARLLNAVESSASTRSALGIDPSASSGLAEIVSAPPGPKVIALEGDHSAEDIEAALGAPADGIWSWGGGEHQVNVEESAVNPPLGQALRIGATDDAVYVGSEDAVVRSALSGDSRLSDDEVVARILEILDDQDAYSARIERQQFDRMWAYIGLPVTLAEFTTVGNGVSLRDGQAIATVVYHHASEDLAEENVTRLEEYHASTDWLSYETGAGGRAESIERSGEFVIVTYSVDPPEATPLGMTLLLRLQHVGYIG